MQDRVEHIVRVCISRRMYFYPLEEIGLGSLLRDQLGFGCASLSCLLESLAEMLARNGLRTDERHLMSNQGALHTVDDIVRRVERALQSPPLAVSRTMEAPRWLN